MPKKKTKRKKGKKKTTTTSQTSRQHVHVDPVTRGGLPPGLVLPQVDVEALVRPVAEMVNALGRAVRQQPGLIARLDPEVVRDAMAAAAKTRRSESSGDT